MMLAQCGLSSETVTVRRPIWTYVPWIFFTLKVVPISEALLGMASFLKSHIWLVKDELQ